MHQQHARSPHSPFQFNQLQANINPFTPTNSYESNSKLTSASNAAAMVKLAVTARSKHQDLTLTGTSMPVKRCFNQTNENNNTHSVSVSNVENAPNDVNMNEDGQNQSVNDDEQHNSSSNHCNSCNDSSSLPKNKRLALRQCLVSR